MFCDEIKLKLVAGNGGDGCSSFRREKYVPKGGPDGGDGGNGGDIIIKVAENINTLGHLTNGKTYRADKGIPGMGKKMHGKNAEHLIIKVPRGTIILNGDKSQALADLNKDGEEFRILQGGKGGLGNARFKSSTHQAPRFAESGEPGESKAITLELKLVADVGLIGMPSAGKSTLISVISNAKPKIAAYHFTTLVPNLGVVNMGKFGGGNTDTFAVADIPGLIEGASEGKGLGHQFLKHITRTKLLVHILDGTLDDIEDNYKKINKELKNFDKDLSKRQQIVVINKIDSILEEDLKEKLKKLKKVTKKLPLYPISGVTREGLPPLLFEISKKLQEIKKQELIEPPKKAIIPVLKPHLEKEKFKIEKIIKGKESKVFQISGKRIEQVAIMTSTATVEGMERMYHYINRLGIQDAIKKKGARFGDIIRIKDKNIPYRK